MKRRAGAPYPPPTRPKTARGQEEHHAFLKKAIAPEMCRELPTTTGANRLTVRRRIPLRNDENHLCAGSERPPRVPVRRSACGTVDSRQDTTRSGCADVPKLRSD